tara:strand:+ start:138 stop:578 length:441 start_codon:yes stop_codon:yes gene_type:complete
MIVSCPNCKKRFDIEDNLIPESGRLLQCSSCSNKWFFNISKKNDNNNIKKNDLLNEVRNTDIPKETEDIITEAEKIRDINDNKSKNKVSFLKVLLIIIISFSALIVFLDTFKIPLNNFLPGFIFFLDNFYMIFNDIYLFFKDLIRA